MFPLPMFKIYSWISDVALCIHTLWIHVGHIRPIFSSYLLNSLFILVLGFNIFSVESLLIHPSSVKTVAYLWSTYSLKLQYRSSQPEILSHQLSIIGFCSNVVFDWKQGEVLRHPYWCVISSIVFCALCLTELCKCWAISSGQVAGQMRKQMDRFGLNPSHGISSPWPSSSNLHVFAEENEQNGGVYVCGLGEGSWMYCY